eukprot:scaffold116175_cov28-Tisochrysis_lutea.AAC.1
MLDMVAVLMFGCHGSARDESRACLGRGGARSPALRVRGVGLDPSSSVAAVGGEGSGALHDPIF